MLHTFVNWLGSLPAVALYLVAGLCAAVENVFPPLPSDVVVAFAAFGAARGHGFAGIALAAVLVGNVAGAMFMYAVGAKYGTGAVLRHLGGADAHEAKLRTWYSRYGLLAIAVSRFLPGVRALVPPIAGALHVGPVRSAIAMGLASGIWYGAITYLAFTAGGDFEALAERIGAGQRWVGIGAGSLAAVALAAWWVWRRRARAAT